MVCRLLLVNPKSKLKEENQMSIKLSFLCNKGFIMKNDFISRIGRLFAPQIWVCLIFLNTLFMILKWVDSIALSTRSRDIISNKLGGTAYPHRKVSFFIEKSLWIWQSCHREGKNCAFVVHFQCMCVYFHLKIQPKWVSFDSIFFCEGVEK